jgi:autoinducer 2-degrading protein
MIATCVHVKVKAERVDEFIAASKSNHLGSVAEEGNFRFDICQSDDDPTSFFLYEAYVSAEAAAAHKQTEHYNTWRDTVADWMAKPRQGIRYNVLLPEG